MSSAIDIKKSHLAFALTIVVFLINPFIAITINLAYILSSKNFSNRNFNLLIVLIALYLGLINVTKLPESDLLNYKEYFHSAAQYGLFEYILIYEWRIVREPIFYILTYVLNKVFLDSYNLYIVTTTFTIYYLTLKSLYKYWKHYDGRNSIIIVSILLFTLFYIIFSGSSHLIRQMLAGSIFMYYLTRKIVDKKNNYLLPILAVLIHNSSIVLFLLTLIPGIEKRFKLKSSFVTILVLITSIILLQVIVSMYSHLIYSIPVLGGIAMVVFEFEPFSDTRSFVADYSILARFILPIVLLGISLLVYKSKRQFQVKNYTYINIFIIYSVIVEILFQLGINFIAVRLNYYMYFFMPILILHFFSLFRSKRNLYITLPIQAFIILFLFSSLIWFLSFSTWTYASPLEIIFSPVIFYFLK